MKAKFTNVRKRDLPRANTVNVNFFPRDSHVILRRKMSIRLARLLVVLTNVTGLNKGFHVALQSREYQ
jgi:hypothetical protein